MYHRREDTSYPRRHSIALARGHEWVDTEYVDDGTDEFCELPGVLSEVFWIRCQLELTIFKPSVEFCSKLKKAAME